MKTLPYGLKKAINETGFIPIELHKNAIYEEGKTYWCGYWSQWYKVLNAEYVTHRNYKELVSVTVQWQDGRIGTHCTALDPWNDWELQWTEQ